MHDQQFWYPETQDANNKKSAHPTQVSVLQKLVHHPEGHYATVDSRIGLCRPPPLDNEATCVCCMILNYVSSAVQMYVTHQCW